MDNVSAYNLLGDALSTIERQREQIRDLKPMT